MWIDVSELHNFYQSDLGIVVQHTLQQQIGRFWPHAHQQNVAAYGYGIPYLEHYRSHAARTFNMMPASMGVVHWPLERPNLTVLTEEVKFPLNNQCIDKLLLIHGFEYTCQVSELLRECWRVLNDGGTLLAVVPNRRGLWAQADSTPFGHGQPYTGQQLSNRLEQSSFTPENVEYCLYTPPAMPQILSNIANGLEDFGRRWSKRIGGLVIIQARKSVLAPLASKTSSWGSAIFVPQPCKG